MSISKQTSKIMWGHVNARIAASGSPPINLMGFVSRESGVEVEFGIEGADYAVAELEGPALSLIVARSLSAKFNLAQLEPEVLGHAFGLTPTTYGLKTGGGIPPNLEIALTLIGYRGAGATPDPIALVLPRAKSLDSVSIAFKKASASEIPCMFKALDGSAGLYNLLFGRTIEAGTLAAGVLTRLQGTPLDGIAHLTVANEAAAPDDDLTDVTAGASTVLTAGELLTLQLFSEAQVVTVKHAANTIELDGAVDVVLRKLQDRLTLMYVAAGTKWVEMDRYLVP
jgi:hypothetical protein